MIKHLIMIIMKRFSSMLCLNDDFVMICDCYFINIFKSK